MSEPASILIVRYSALGDVVLATSLLEPLKRRFPSARVEWVTEETYAPLLKGLPELSAVHGLSRECWAETTALAVRLRGRFDLTIDLQNKVRSAAIATAASRARVVFRRRTASQALFALFGSDPPLVHAHQTCLYTGPLASLGIEGPGRLKVSLSAQAHALAEDALRGVENSAVAVAPGARWVTKRWPAKRFAQVAQALARDGHPIVLCGGPGDREAFAEFRAEFRGEIAADLSPLPVDALAAAISRTRLLIACDSGTVHLASAVGTPALALFGPTSAARWGPFAPGRALSLGLDCSPCSNHGGDYCPLGHHRCLADLDPQAVLGGAREMLVS